ncbi:MAG: c-type cytochrome, partial [Gammaproteobacteria bacterium]|nr:c-type cytochrome [Gammaproteobacteria bacterium]
MVRKKLESFHGGTDSQAVDYLWGYLNHPDRSTRYAARVALEHQPVATWKRRAVNERGAGKAVQALIALARQGDKALRGNVLAAWNQHDLSKLDTAGQLAALRAYALTFIRMGEPTPEERIAVTKQLDAIYPAKVDAVNAELARLLVYLDSPTVVDKTLALIAKATRGLTPAWGDLVKRSDRYGPAIANMLNNMPPTDKIHYAFVLRNVRYGWTMPQRRQYFQFFVDAGKYKGGASYAGFLHNIRDEALAKCSEAEQQALAAITGQDIEPPAAFEVKPPKGPGRIWDMKNAEQAVRGGLTSRSFESGRNLFHAIGCAACHRFDGQGGDIGPDLTSVRNKFSTRDLLESMIEPSKSISDQFGSEIVSTKAGDDHF